MKRKKVDAIGCLRHLGVYTFLAGVFSFMLEYFGRDLMLLMWVDAWGVRTGNLIRLSLIGLGMLMVATSLWLRRRQIRAQQYTTIGQEAQGGGGDDDDKLQQVV